MDIIIFFIGIGVLHIHIVIAYRLLSKKIEEKFRRQNKRLTGNKEREIKILRELEKINRKIREVIYI